MKKLFCFAASFVLLLTSGCSKESNVDSLKLISTAAIDDYEKSQILLTSEVVHPNLSEGKPQSYLKESAAPYIGQILQSQNSRSYWSHTETLLLGEKTAKRDISRFVSYFLKNPQIRLSCTPIIVKNSTASDFLTNRKENMRGFEIKHLLNEAINTCQTVDMPLYKLSDNLSSNNAVALIPAIIGYKNNDNTEYAMHGAGIIKDYRLIGYLDSDECALYNILKGNGQNAVLTTSNGNVYKIASQKGQITSNTDSNRPSVRFNYQIGLELCEQSNKNLLFKKPNKELSESREEQEIISNIHEFIENCSQTWDADVLQLENTIKKQHPIYYKSLPDDFSYKSIDSPVNIDITIEETGLTIDKGG